MKNETRLHIEKDKKRREETSHSLQVAKEKVIFLKMGKVGIRCIEGCMPELRLKAGQDFVTHIGWRRPAWTSYQYYKWILPAAAFRFYIVHGTP